MIAPPSARPSTEGPLRAITASFVDRIARVDASGWDALFPGDSPFVRHDFLAALERCGCVGESTGWLPQHLLLHDEAGRLVAAAPVYLKLHSYGEFVFDFAWANASQQLRRPYYPKLVNAVPFTPSAGPRIGAIDAASRQAAVEALRRYAETRKLSSAHVLFAQDEDCSVLREARWLERHDLQFQWFNRGDADFTAFVARLSSDKRKKLLRERRRVAEAGLRLDVVRGQDLDDRLWAGVYALYANTYEERGQAPYLTPEFLLDYGGRDGSPLRVVLCHEGEHLVAMALLLQSGTTLYGRHWGAADRYHSLHFECCYYQGIELCLREGLARYDAGTQGEHKLARGFEPVPTHSFHHLTDPRLAYAVDQYLSEERGHAAARREQLMQHSPYRNTPAA